MGMRRHPRGDSAFVGVTPTQADVAERAARTPLQWCRESHSFPWLREEPREPRRGAGGDGSTRHDASRGSTAGFNSLLCALLLGPSGATSSSTAKFDQQSELKSHKSPEKARPRGGPWRLHERR